MPPIGADVQLIGIDCATKPKNIGIALAEVDREMRVCEVHAGVPDPWGTVSNWLTQARDTGVLIALDAPLGWPRALAEVLDSHQAGESVEQHDANALFRRSTDPYIRSKVGKQPLDVGADWIARTAHAALTGLARLRTTSSLPIPLAWTSGPSRDVSAIEVYPAATLKAHGLPFQGYKDPVAGRDMRARILCQLEGVKMSDDCKLCVLANADGLDAVICAVAAADFVSGAVMPPDDLHLARKEGWIWCRAPGA